MENNSVKLNFNDFSKLYFNRQLKKYIYEINKVAYLKDNKIFIIDNDFFTNSHLNNIEFKIKKIKNIPYFIDGKFYEKDDNNIKYFISITPIDLVDFFKNKFNVSYTNLSEVFFKLFKNLKYKNINKIISLKSKINLKNEEIINILNNFDLDFIINYEKTNYKYVLFNSDGEYFLIFKFKNKEDIKKIYSDLISYCFTNKVQINIKHEKIFIPITDNIEVF